jgi:anti-sigma-K factor RskA/putative zinc finger protein
MTHIVEDLPLLLSGEASRAQTQAAAAHLRECDDCRQELVNAVVAHAALTSAQRFAPELLAAVRDDTGAGAALPALPAFDAVRAAIVAEPSRPDTARQWRRGVLVAAAAVIVAGGGTALGLGLSGGTHPATRTVALKAFGIGHGTGQVRMSGEKMSVDAATLPKLDTEHRYEVWLTNGARTRMQPVGWIGSNGTATLTVPPDLASSFGAVEVSVQSVDAPSYDYSGTSVLRGSY